MEKPTSLHSARAATWGLRKVQKPSPRSLNGCASFLWPRDPRCRTHSSYMLASLSRSWRGGSRCRIDVLVRQHCICCQSFRKHQSLLSIRPYHSCGSRLGLRVASRQSVQRSTNCLPRAFSRWISVIGSAGTIACQPLSSSSKTWKPACGAWHWSARLLHPHRRRKVAVAPTPAWVNRAWAGRRGSLRGRRRGGGASWRG